MSITETCRDFPIDAVRVGFGVSPSMRRRQRWKRAASSLRRTAETVPAEAYRTQPDPSSDSFSSTNVQSSSKLRMCRRPPVLRTPVGGGSGSSASHGEDPFEFARPIRDLAPLVARLGKHETEQPRHADGPEIGADALRRLPVSGTGLPLPTPAPRCRPELNGGGRVQPPAQPPSLSVEMPVGMVEEEEILALHVEHQRLGICDLAQYAEPNRLKRAGSCVVGLTHAGEPF